MPYNVAIRGIRASLPQGTIVGRAAGAGNGPAVPLSLDDLRRLGVSATQDTQAAAGVDVQSSSTDYGQNTSLIFGTGLSVVSTSKVATVTWAGVPIQQGGAAVGPATTINFTGATVTLASGVATVAVTGGGSAPLATVAATVSGGSVTVQAQSNVSSITYTGVGRYRINFGTVLPSQYYCLALSGRFPTGTISSPIINIDNTTGYGATTAHCDIVVEGPGGTATDLSQLSAFVYSAGAASSTYLLDVLGVSASGAYSTRQLKGSATKCMRVQRSSDNTQMDIGFVSGSLDTATLTTFMGASTTGWAVTWYDQSGNGNDMTQLGSVGASPYIWTSGALAVDAAGKPALQMVNGYGSQLGNTSFSPLQSAFTMSAAYEPTTSGWGALASTRTTAYGNSLAIGLENATGNHLLSVFNPGVSNNNCSSPGATLNQMNVAQATSTSGAGSSLAISGYMNNTSVGSASNSASTTPPANNGTTFGYDSYSTAALIGFYAELIFFPSVLTTGQLSTIEASQAGL